MAVDKLSPPALQVPRSRAWIVLLLVPVLALVGVGAWFARHPAPLTTSPEAATVATPIGVAVYVGVYRLPGDATRTLHLSDVEVVDDGDATIAVAPLVCHGAALSVTTKPTTFCDRLEAASGAVLRPGDQLVLQVTGESTGSATIDPVRVSYRDGLQWATQAAGRPIEVTVLER